MTVRKVTELEPYIIEGERRMDRIKRIAAATTNRLHWVVLVMAVIAIVVTVFTPATEQDPAGFAGISAPIVALCTATVALTQAVFGGGLQIGRTKGIIVGVGSVLSAYLWMADAADSHVLSLEVPTTLLILFALAAMVVLVVTLGAQEDNPQSNDQSSNKGVDGKE